MGSNTCNNYEYHEINSKMKINIHIAFQSLIFSLNINGILHVFIVYHPEKQLNTLHQINNNNNFILITDGPVTKMCPPRTDQTKVDAIRSETTEIEVKPPETCLTHPLQVT